MKKLLIIISIFFVATSFATSQESRSANKIKKNEKKIAEEATVKKAIESQRYIVKLDKIYLIRGGMVDLMPRRNFIIIDGSRASISAAYLGRQYDIKPIAGISMKGMASNYILKESSSKIKYEINMKVENSGNSFNVYLSVGKNGTCTVSLSSMMIDNVRYRGHLVPIEEKQTVKATESETKASNITI